MKGYVSKLDRAISIAKSYGYKETDKGFKYVVKHIHAKLMVNGKTIGKNLDTGKITIS